MVLLQFLITYISIGILFNLFAEFKMKDDPEWDNEQRLIILAFWPLVIYAHTL